MVNEDRVKQLYKIAVYEKNEEKIHRQAGQFYRTDYIVKEVFKSIVTGILAYAIMMVLWAMINWDLLIHKINTLEITGTVIVMLVCFVVFMAAYIFVTILVYVYRYKTSIKKVEEYVEELKRAQSMFEREEKLKG